MAARRAPAWNGDLGRQNRFADYFATRAHGVLGRYPHPDRIRFGADLRPGRHAVLDAGRQHDHPNSLNTNLGNNPQLLDTAGGGYTSIEYIFIRFAGFTFGKSASAYASPWQGFPGNNTSFLLGGQNTDTGVNNVQYTAQFGNGLSATIGLDDPTVWDRTSLYNLSTGLNAVGVTGNAYGDGAAMTRRVARQMLKCGRHARICAKFGLAAVRLNDFFSVFLNASTTNQLLHCMASIAAG